MPRTRTRSPKLATARLRGQHQWQTWVRAESEPRIRLNARLRARLEAQVDTQARAQSEAAAGARAQAPTRSLADVLARAPASVDAPEEAPPRRDSPSMPVLRVMGSWTQAQEDQATHRAIQNHRSLPEIIGARMMRTHGRVTEALSLGMVDPPAVADLELLDTLRRLVQMDMDGRTSTQGLNGVSVVPGANGGPATVAAPAPSALAPAPAPAPVSIPVPATEPAPDPNPAVDEAWLASLMTPPVQLNHTANTPQVHFTGASAIDPHLLVISAAAPNNLAGPVPNGNVQVGQGVQANGVAPDRLGLMPEFIVQYDDEPPHVSYADLGDILLNRLQLARDKEDCDWCNYDWADPTPEVDMPVLTFELNRSGHPFVSRMCSDCAVSRINIVKHSLHGPWTPVQSVPVNRPESLVNLDTGHSAVACDVCMSLAVASCRDCPLLVCADCKHRLDHGCLRSVDRLILDLGAGVIRKDAVVISRIPLEAWLQ